VPYWGGVPQVSPQDLVWSLKQQLAERLSVPPAQQRLLYRGKALAGTSLITH
uniref:Ubiquitin-like domain-containing protein n=1 Tax=Meleagris gallopavo TaxID=9103 RepID=A0A803XL41_MELGA